MCQCKCLVAEFGQIKGLIRLISVTIFNFDRCVKEVWRQSILSAYIFISGMFILSIQVSDGIPQKLIM